MGKIIWDRKVLGRLLDGLDIPENKSGCWLWKGCTTINGYGLIKVSDKVVHTHRLAYTIFVGVIPENKLILHSCDNRICCNPTHLRPGTHQDNMNDMSIRKRCYSGEDHYGSKLSRIDIPKIRRMLACGYTQECIGKVFGVSDTSISQIKHGRNWKQPRRFPRRS